MIIEPGEVDGQDVAVVQLLEDDQGLAAGQFATLLLGKIYHIW